jgi:hypothetical protein
MSLKQANKDNKLSPKYYGLYKVLQKIGTMAYKLELPASSRVHPVFHVSFLNKVIGDNIPIQTIFPELDEEGKIILELEAITDLGHYNFLINLNNQVLHKLSTQGSLFISKVTKHYICSIPKAT